MQHARRSKLDSVKRSHQFKLDSFELSHPHNEQNYQTSELTLSQQNTFDNPIAISQRQMRLK